MARFASKESNMSDFSIDVSIENFLLSTPIIFNFINSHVTFFVYYLTTLRITLRSYFSLLKMTASN